MPAKVLDQLAHAADLIRVQADGRLIEDQQIGLVHQRIREAHALAVALRERADDPVLDVLQPAQFLHIAHALLEPAAGHSLELRAVNQVLRHPHVRIERHVLRHVTRCAARLDRLLEHIEPGDRGRPEVAGMKLERILIVVLFPAPLGPRNPTISPFPTSKDILLIAVNPAYFLVRFSTLITARQRYGYGRQFAILGGMVRQHRGCPVQEFCQPIVAGRIVRRQSIQKKFLLAPSAIPQSAIRDGYNIVPSIRIFGGNGCHQPRPINAPQSPFPDHHINARHDRRPPGDQVNLHGRVAAVGAAPGHTRRG